MAKLQAKKAVAVDYVSLVCEGEFTVNLRKVMGRWERTPRGEEEGVELKNLCDHQWKTPEESEKAQNWLKKASTNKRDRS